MMRTGEFFMRDGKMAKILQCEKFIVIAIAVFILNGCAYEAKVSQTNWRPLSVNLVSPAQFKDSDLEIVWQGELPIKAGESLREMSIIGRRIYALSSSNFLAALNRENGNVVFSRYLAEAGFPVIGLGLYENELFTIAGSRLLEMDADHGADVNAVELKFSETCPAVRNRSFFYIAGTDKRIHSLRTEDRVQVFEVAADDDSAVTSVIADENFVVFATDSGFCAAFTPDGPKKLWQFNVAGGIAAPVVRDGDSIFFAGKDTNVYRLNAKTGEFIWKCQMGAILEKGPTVAQKCVYQYVRDNGLTAIDKGSGKILWQLPEGIDLLAEGGDKAYVFTLAGEIAAMDNVKCKKLYSVSIPAVSKYAVNVTDSKIYVADYAGRVACLKPIK